MLFRVLYFVGFVCTMSLLCEGSHLHGFVCFAMFVISLTLMLFAYAG